MTPAEASAILDREHTKFEAQYVEPPDPEYGKWTPFARALQKHKAWEQWAVAALEATGEDIEEPPAEPKPPRDTSAWYARNIAATERRIARDEAAIRRFEDMPSPDTSDALAAINAPLKQRQRGMAGELKAWRAAEAARRDLPAARARLTWLRDHCT